MTHIHIEEALNSLLATLAQNEQEMNNLEITYFQRAQLAIALGLHPRFKKPLRALGKLRNVFAHELDVKLDDQAVNNFYSTFDGIEKQIINQAYLRSRDIASQSLGEEKPEKVRELSPPDRFQLYATVLRSAIMKAVVEVEDQYRLISETMSHSSN